jgi:hypothetical protein
VIDSASTSELAQIASEIGADVLSGDLSYPFGTGALQLSEPELFTQFDGVSFHRSPGALNTIGRRASQHSCCSPGQGRRWPLRWHRSCCWRSYLAA